MISTKHDYKNRKIVWIMKVSYDLFTIFFGNCKFWNLTIQRVLGIYNSITQFDFEYLMKSDLSPTVSKVWFWSCFFEGNGLSLILLWIIRMVSFKLVDPDLAIGQVRISNLLITCGQHKVILTKSCDGLRFGPWIF